MNNKKISISVVLIFSIALLVPLGSSEERFIHDFEDETKGHYYTTDGTGGDAVISGKGAYSNYSLELQNDQTATNNYFIERANLTVSEGDYFNFWIRAPRINYADRHGVRFYDSNDNQLFTIGFQEGVVYYNYDSGGTNQLTNGESHTWYRAEFNFTSDTSTTLSAYDTDGNQLGSVTGDANGLISDISNVRLVGRDTEDFDVDMYVDQLGKEDTLITPDLPVVKSAVTPSNLLNDQTYGVYGNISHQNSLSDISNVSVSLDVEGSDEKDIPVTFNDTTGEYYTNFNETVNAIGKGGTYNITVNATDINGNSDVAYNTTETLYWNYVNNTVETVNGDKYLNNVTITGTNTYEQAIYYEGNPVNFTEYYDSDDNGINTATLFEVTNLDANTVEETIEATYNNTGDWTMKQSTDASNLNTGYLNYTLDTNKMDETYLGDKIKLEHQLELYKDNDDVPYDAGDYDRIYNFLTTEHETKTSTSGTWDALASVLDTYVVNPLENVLNTLLEPLAGLLESIEDAVNSIVSSLIEFLVSILTAMINAIGYVMGYISSIFQIGAYNIGNHGLEVIGEMDGNESFTYYNYTGDYPKSINESDLTTIERMTFDYTLNVTKTATEWRENNKKTMDDITVVDTNQLYVTEVYEIFEDPITNETLDEKETESMWDAGDDCTFIEGEYGGEMRYWKYSDSPRTHRCSTANFTITKDYEELNMTTGAYDWGSDLYLDVEGGTTLNYNDDGTLYSYADTIDVNEIKNYITINKTSVKYGEGVYTVKMYKADSVTGDVKSLENTLEIENVTHGDNIEFGIQSHQDTVQSIPENHTIHVYNYSTTFGESSEITSYSVNTYGINLDDAPNGISQILIVGIALMSMLGILLTVILDLVPQGLIDVVNLFLGEAWALISGIANLITGLVYFVNTLLVDGFKWTVLGVKVYVVVKGARYGKKLLEAFKTEGSEDIMTALEYILDDLKAQYVTVINLSDSIYRSLLHTFRMIIELLHFIRSLIPWI